MNPSSPFRADCTGLLCALLLAGFFPSTAPAQELGPLFFTPERRQELDRQREFKLQQRQEISEEDQMLTINGVVTRSSGKRTVWINGVALDAQAGGLAVTPNRKNPGTIVVQTEDGPGARANVGDTVNRNTGETSDLLGSGRILIKPGRSNETRH
jgi:hypothetical protein